MTTPAVAATDQSKSREVRTLSVVARRFWWFVILVTALALAATWFLTNRQEKIYEAQTGVFLRTTESEFLFPFAESAPSSLLRNASTEQLYAESPKFKAFVNETTPAGVRVTTRDASPRLLFTARGTNPEAVATAANLWAETYVKEHQADVEASIFAELEFLGEAIAELESELSILRVDLDRFDELLDATENADEYARLLSQRVSLEALLQPQLDPIERELADLRADESALNQRTRFFGPEVAARVERVASVPATPVSPNVFRNLLVGGALGLILGTALPFTRVTAAGRIEDRAEVSETTELVPLANIPRYRSESDTEIEVLDNPGSIPAAQYQALLTAVEFASQREPISEIMVSSAVPGDGKTTVSINLAALAAQYLNVLLIDGDMRRPDIYKRLGIPNDVGLVDVLEGMPLTEARHTVNRDGTSFDVLAAGDTDKDPALLLRGSRWGTVVDSLFLYDLVIVDAPPVLAVTDALLLGATLDAQLFVTRARGTRRDELAEAAKLLSSNRTRTLGVVVNQDSATKRTYNYYGPE